MPCWVWFASRIGTVSASKKVRLQTPGISHRPKEWRKESRVRLLRKATMRFDLGQKSLGLGRPLHHNKQRAINSDKIPPLHFLLQSLSTVIGAVGKRFLCNSVPFILCSRRRRSRQSTYLAVAWSRRGPRLNRNHRKNNCGRVSAVMVNDVGRFNRPPAMQWILSRV